MLQISNEEKLQIAQHYLLSSPPGQFSEVLSGKGYLRTKDKLHNYIVTLHQN